MDNMGWKYFGVSNMGLDHQMYSDDKPNQDSYKIEEKLVINNKEYFMIALSDGMGSYDRTDLGSYMACNYFMDMIKKFLENNSLENLSKEKFLRYVNDFRENMKQYTRERVPLSAYNATFLMSVLSDDGCLFINVGDGAIISLDAPEARCICKPQKADKEKENVTYSILGSDVASIIDYQFIKEPVNAIVMHTDCIDKQSMQNYMNPDLCKPNLEFYKKIPQINKLKSHPNAGEAEDLTRDFKEYLKTPEWKKYDIGDDTTIFFVMKNEKNIELSIDKIESNQTPCGDISNNFKQKTGAESEQSPENDPYEIHEGNQSQQYPGMSENESCKSFEGNQSQQHIVTPENDNNKKITKIPPSPDQQQLIKVWEVIMCQQGR